jgi:hypothetical protein
MYTPVMTMSTSNRCRATLEKLLSSSPNRKTAPVYELLPQIQTALASGWTRKELWESLTSDGLDVKYKTFTAIIRRARNRPGTTAPPNGKSDELPKLDAHDDTNCLGHDPLINLRRLEANRPGFHWHARPRRIAPAKGTEEPNDKIQR